MKRVPFLGILTGVLVMGLSGCRTDMWVQQRVEAQDNSEFYALSEPVPGPDGKLYGLGSRPIPPNTIPRGRLQDPNDPMLTGKDAQGNLLKTLPPQLSHITQSKTEFKKFLDLGEQKYNIFCAPCHGKAGDGQGMIALRGQWPRMPASLVADRLRTQPIGYFYGVATNGFGIMYGYGKRMTPEERWAVAAYVRVLQLSQGANIRDLPPEDIEQLLQAQADTPTQIAERKNR